MKILEFLKGLFKKKCCDVCTGTCVKEEPKLELFCDVCTTAPLTKVETKEGSLFLSSLESPVIEPMVEEPKVETPVIEEPKVATEPKTKKKKTNKPKK